MIFEGDDDIRTLTYDVNSAIQVQFLNETVYMFTGFIHSISYNDIHYIK